MDELREYLDQKIGKFSWDDDKTTRVRLEEAADELGVSTKSIKRYVDELRDYITITEQNEGGKRGKFSYIVLAENE